MKIVEDAIEIKKTPKNWLLTSIHPSLGMFSILPNQLFMSLILIHLDGRGLSQLILVSKSFAETIKKFKKTDAGRENFRQLLLSQLKNFAKKEHVEIKDLNNLPIPTTLSTLEEVIEIKSRAQTSDEQRGKITVYEVATGLICCLFASAGGAGIGGETCKRELSAKQIKVCRVIFMGLCAASSYGFYYTMNSGNDTPDNSDLKFLSAGTMGITGVTLLIDAVQSLLSCRRQREVREVKSRLSQYQSIHSSINDDSETSETTSSSYYIRLN